MNVTWLVSGGHVHVDIWPVDAMDIPLHPRLRDQPGSSLPDLIMLERLSSMRFAASLNSGSFGATRPFRLVALSTPSTASRLALYSGIKPQSGTVEEVISV